MIERISVPVEQGTVSAGSIRTSYLTAGGGPNLLLVHGAGGGAVNWYKAIGPLSAHFRSLNRLRRKINDLDKC